MYICLLPQNQLLCQQAAVVAKQRGHISIDIPSLIRFERGLVAEPEHRTSKIAIFLMEIHCISIYTCLLPENQLLYQQAAVDAMQLGHISVSIPSLFRTERGLAGEPEPRTSKIATFL